jgi:intergrase/recombinase
MTKELVVRMSLQFKAWLVSNGNDERYMASLENYLTKSFIGLILNSPQNIIECTSKMKTTSKYPILALRPYIKYLEEVGQITSELDVQLKRVLKVKKSKPDNYVPIDDRIREVIGKLTDERDKLFFQILAYSGVRITEMPKMLVTMALKILSNTRHLPGIR